MRHKTVIYYPIMLNLQGKKCIVVGGGNVALRKVKMLLDCGAEVTVVSPRPHLGMVNLSKKKTVRLIRRNFKGGDLTGATFAVASTDEREINQAVAHEAKKRGILVNVVDDPEESEFIVPSFLRHGDLIIAISTSGTSPALARKIRMRLEKSFGKEYASLLSIIGEVRSSMKKRGIIFGAKAWQEALDLDSLMRLIKKGQKEKAKTLLLNRLKIY